MEKRVRCCCGYYYYYYVHITEIIIHGSYSNRKHDSKCLPSLRYKLSVEGEFEALQQLVINSHFTAQHVVCVPLLSKCYSCSHHHLTDSLS